jgi:hypothetical protein
MTILTVLLGSILAAMYGALYHLVRGGSLGRLFLYLVVSGVAFWFGHLVANILGFTFLSIGPVRVGLATLFALAGLVAAEWLSAVDSRQGS